MIIEQTCLTVLGMDSGYTKVALPFSVKKKTRFHKKSDFGLFFLKVSKVWPFQNGLIIERQS